VVAAATFLRALWKFVRLFFKDRRSFPDFFFDLLSSYCCAPRSGDKKRPELIWPFRWKWARRLFFDKDSPFQDPNARDGSPDPSDRSSSELQEVEKVPNGSTGITNRNAQTGENNNTATTPGTGAASANIRVRVPQVQSALRLYNIARLLYV
jgi:hypothetical protein